MAIGLAGSSAAADEPKDKPQAQDDRETAVLPLVGGDTDNGFGGGAIGSIASFDKGDYTYRWKVEFGAFYATKGGVFSPSYEDAYALITFPQLLDNRLRLEIRPSFTKDTALRYYGVGNLAPDTAMTDPKRDFYERLHPALFVQALTLGTRPWSFVVGARYTYNRIGFDSSSTLARDLVMTGETPEAPHSVLAGETGIVYDSRDNELAPNSGQYHQIKVRASPGLGSAFPYAYRQLDAIARAYITLIPHKLVFAVRGVVDAQFGDVPFYEMSRYEDTSAIGGSQGVRGVPAYRFYGRLKAFGNVELRTQTFRFRAYDRPFILGFAAFFDAGRLWSAVDKSRPDLDGTGLGLHWGIGGGLRVQQGRVFLVRADVAWSPDARPIGAYLIANHAF